jgi:hypothetical protein
MNEVANRMRAHLRSLPSLVILIAFGVGCSSSTPEVMDRPRAPEPITLPEVATIEPTEESSALRTLDEILGPISFDPDTVKAGRFDTGRMWTFDAPPVDYFEEAYGFRPEQDWFRRARMASIRFATWCSASFVSANGLVLTNHHCGREPITDVTGDGESLLENGFFAATLEEERRVPELFVDQLVQITDVTDRVLAAMDAAEDDQARMRAREGAIQAVQEEFDADNGMNNQVVTLFNGGRYSVYTYKQYDDVRLVMAPELAIGYFGGDPDNFTYPRYNLDVSFFRVYENGEPLDTSEFFFQWSDGGPKAGEAVFVLGNPGATTRLNTVAQLAFTRDHDNPAILNLIRSRMKVLRNYLDANPDLPNREEQNNFYFSLSNSEKAFTGQQNGLLDSYLLARKADWEDDFRQALMNDPLLEERYGDPWTEIAEARMAMEPFGDAAYAFSFGGQLRSAYLNKAFLLQQLHFMLSSGMDPASDQILNMIEAIQASGEVAGELEEGMLAAQLGDFRLLLGPEDDITRGLLGMRDPAGAAVWLIDQTVLGDPEAVAALVDGAPQSIAESSEPLIRGLDGIIPRIIQMQQTFGAAAGREEAAMSRLARAVYDVYGTSIPPDATFTLRIADGVVTGYPYNGTEAPEWTTFYGLYDRWASAGGEDPWALPERWQNPPAEFDLSTPINFVSTCDIIGGNSGSPVVNQNLELIGVAFDGNIESLPGEFIFLPTLNRCVSVHSEGVIEAIRDLFGFQRLADELRSGRLPN